MLYGNRGNDLEFLALEMHPIAEQASCIVLKQSGFSPADINRKLATSHFSLSLCGTAG